MWNRILKGEYLNSSAYVMGFLLFLAVFQLRALFLQFESGFQLFVHEPTRVLFSWDMFATRTERCMMEWDPPLQRTPVGPLTDLRQLSVPIEWDVIYDSMQDYEYVGRMGCAFESGQRARGSLGESSEKAPIPVTHSVNKIRVKIHCFGPDGNETHREFYCS